MGVRNSEWRYEALSGTIPLDIDENYAHVQPTGVYHYHGLPTLLMKQLGVSNSTHYSIIGWAADGFPIYALYRECGTQVSSSYRFKQRKCLRIGNYSGGKYDGSFVTDYEYVAGSGDLGKCNGKMVTTKDFPHTSYGYFLAAEFLIIPRCFRSYQ